MKQILFFTVWMYITISAFAIEFTVAPLYYIDETTERAVPRNDYHNQLLKELGKVATGMEIRFKNADSSRYNPPQSVGDAIILCRAEQADYLVYGFITRRDHTVQGELRLLDYERKEVIASFFAMDSKDRMDALIQDLAGKLFRFIQETYNILIIPDPPAFTHIRFPLSLGYWMPINSDWIDQLLGIIRIDTGIQIVPSDNVSISSGRVSYLSLEVGISYRLAKGRHYDAWDHGFTVRTPILFHQKFNEQHEAFAGLGLIYALDILSIKKPYEDPTTEIYTNIGFTAGGGWQFRIRERMFIFVDLWLEVRAYDKHMISFVPNVGIIFQPYTKEVVKKW